MKTVTLLQNKLKYLAENKQLVLFYNILIAVLSLLAVGLLIAECFTQIYEKEFEIIDNGIIIIFALDYFIRFFMAEKKLKFIRANIIDLIAIIPFNTIFQAMRITSLLRLTKLFKILRILAFLGKFHKNIDKFIKTNNFHYILFLTIITILLGALGMEVTEHKTLSDSLWWSFVTATTVGYGDISPATTVGRIIAVILMISGIGFIGMLTGTISTFFINRHKEDVTFKDETINNIKSKLSNFDDLSSDDVNSICAILKSLKSKSQ